MKEVIICIVVLIIFIASVVMLIREVKGFFNDIN